MSDFIPAGRRIVALVAALALLTPPPLVSAQDSEKPVEPAKGFQLPTFGIPDLFSSKKPESAKPTDSSKPDASKPEAGKDAAPKPADPAKAAAEKQAADKAMQDSTAKVVEMLFSKVVGKVKVGSAVVNWSEPIVVKQLEVFDPDGALVVSIEEVRLSKSLSAMMLNPAAPSGSKLIRPQFYVSIGEANTNVQRVLGAWFLAEIAGKDPRDTNVEIVDGHVHVVREGTEEQFIFSSVNLAVVPHPEKAADRRIALSWDAPLQGAKFEMEARYVRDDDRMEFSKLDGDYAPLGLGANLVGVIEGMSDKRQLEMKGFWRYDLELLAAEGRNRGWDVDLVGKKQQPLHIKVDIHQLASLMLAAEVEANPAGGVDPSSIEPAPAPGEAQPPTPRDDAENVPVLPTAFRKPKAKNAVARSPSEPVDELDSTSSGDVLDAAPKTKIERPREWAKAITIETDFAWDAARWAEIHIGPASVPITVRKGWALALPTEVPFNDGTLNLAGGVFLAGTRLELAIPAGMLLENVRLTPELCDYVLTWVAPFVAQATNIEGKFSVELDRCLVLLDDVENSDVRGRVLVDRVRMDVGPLIADLAGKILGGDVPVTIKLRLLADSGTEFHFTEGRVFHEGMGLALGDKMLYTNGSIGLDHALDLLIDLTLPFNWLPNGPLGKRLKGTRVQIPVTGTIEKPRLGKVTLPNGLGTGIVNGPLSRLLRNAAGPLPPGQPPYGEPAPGAVAPPPGMLPGPDGPLRPQQGGGGILNRLRRSGILPPR